MSHVCCTAQHADRVGQGVWLFSRGDQGCGCDESRPAGVLVWMSCLLLHGFEGRIYPLGRFELVLFWTGTSGLWKMSQSVLASEGLGLCSG